MDGAGQSCFGECHGTVGRTKQIKLSMIVFPVGGSLTIVNSRPVERPREAAFASKSLLAGYRTPKPRRGEDAALPGPGSHLAGWPSGAARALSVGFVIARPSKPN